MTPLELATAIVARFESFRAYAYPDPGSELALATPSKRWGFEPAQPILESLPHSIQGLRADPWTVGFGATGPNIGPGTNWTEERARVDLTDRLKWYEREVRRLMASVKLAPYQIAALMSFAYNVGIGSEDLDKPPGLTRSTLRRKLLAGDVAGAAAEFPKWNKAKGRVLPGLVNRRAAERALFEGK